ncbi:MAG: ABC transporter substrate-binding protein [Microbacterium sp.]|uniref:ABC transporter substrate-binding protein n=1 Tax=Microbacterium sp. TaxID=51671 RepID=UPI0039E44C10
MFAKKRKVAVGSIAVAGVLAVTGCSGGTTAAPTGSSEGDRGPITIVQGKDLSGFLDQTLADWNEEHPDEQVRLIELPESADAQRAAMVQNAQTKSDEYDVLALDNVLISEFAANRWIEELPEDEFDLDEMLPPVIETATYADKLFSMPFQSDGGMLYYRTDLLEAAGIDGPPTTWDEMADDCEKILALPEAKGVSCYTGQFEKYEGLTVNFTEAVNSAGGHILDADGNPDVDNEGAKAGLQHLVDWFENGLIPADAITFKEEESRRAFQAGELVFHRQWPYQYALANAEDGSSEVAGKFAVAPLAGLDGPGTSTLGGRNLGISAFSKHKATALDFIKFYAGYDQNRQFLDLTGQAPVYAGIYDDPEMIEKYPFLPVLKESILGAIPRPKVVAYGDTTMAIQDAAYSAITGKATVDEALAALQQKLSSIIE